MQIKSINKPRILDTAVLTAYVAAVLIAVVHHEPWSDEAQAWLIARDMPLGKMIFSEMHFEVSPALWHVILWVAQHVFHASYAAMNWIGAVLAIAGATLLIFFAPFPRIVRYLMASSYYVLYQYAVIARPYVMLLLFGAMAAIFYRRRQPIRLAIAAGMLCMVSVHGAILAGAIAAGAALHALLGWKNLDSQSRTRHLIALALISAAFILMLWIAYPSPDVSAYGRGYDGGNWKKVATTLKDTLVDNWMIGAVLLLAMAAFVAWRKELTVFLLGVGGLMTFHSKIYGAPHHEGTIVVAIIVALWIAWPREGDKLPDWFRPVSIAILGVIFGIQTYWGIAAWRHDYLLPYTGSADAAAYLKSVGAGPSETYGTGFGMTAVQAYFPSIEFGNWTTTYLHHATNDEVAIDAIDLRRKPKYVVVNPWTYDENELIDLLRTRGYEVVHVSPGEIFFKQSVWVKQRYLIFGRVER